jgi:hypothetical protein
VKKRLTLGIAATLLAATVALAAGPYPRTASERRPADPRMAANVPMRDDNPIVQVFTPRTSAAPHIIHVPQLGEENDIEAERDDRAALPREDDVAPPPPYRRNDVLSDSPPPARQLSPIYPTPKFGAESERSEKFAPPDEAAMPPAASRYQY